MEQVSHASSITPAQNASIPLEQQREDFKKNRFIAMPLAGTVVWALLGISAPFVSELTITWLLYIGTGAIFYLGAGLSYLTGERFFAKKAAKNSFDRLFFVGILAGLMWMPLSWAIEHWIGYFHTLTRTFGIVAAWYLFPDARVEAISAVIVAVYIVSLITLERRFQSIKSN